MNASLTSAFTGEAGVWARVEKAGVKERDHRTRPPTGQLGEGAEGIAYFDAR